VLPDRTVGEKFVAFGEDLAEWREVKRIENLETSRKFPRSEERNDADDTKPIENQLAGALPPAIGSQGIRLIDGDDVERVLFLFGRKPLLRFLPFKCSTKQRQHRFSRQDAKAQSDAPGPIIPNECEGSEKDFSLRSK